jgi:hypothetical protein
VLPTLSLLIQAHVPRALPRSVSLVPPLAAQLQAPSPERM